jgi:predicted naringenin-chalcone synthase
MTWRIGDHGFRMTLSARVPDLIEAHLTGWVVAWLAEQGLALGDVRSWAVHPGGPRILSSVERALGLERASSQVSREVLAECGNMSSATILFILDRFKRLEAPRPCVALAFGPGLVVEALLLV